MRTFTLICCKRCNKKMIPVAGQTFIEYEKEFDKSNQTYKGYEIYFGDNKIKWYIRQICGDNLKDQTCSKQNESYKNNSMNRFIKVSNNNKRELQSNKQLLLK